MLLQHIQHGMVERLDKHIKHLERFDSHVQNHFNKNSGSASGSVAASSSDSDFTLNIENDGDSVSTL